MLESGTFPPVRRCAKPAPVCSPSAFDDRPLASLLHHRPYRVRCRRTHPSTPSPGKNKRSRRAGVDYIQLREKDVSTRELESLAREAVSTVRGARKLTTDHWLPTTVLLINSRTDVALAVEADGVHLRSSDSLLSFAEEVTRAAENKATFAVLAPIFKRKKYGLGIRAQGISIYKGHAKQSFLFRARRHHCRKCPYPALRTQASRFTGRSAYLQTMTFPNMQRLGQNGGVPFISLPRPFAERGDFDHVSTTQFKPSHL